jgi:hypothetical protein
MTPPNSPIMTLHYSVQANDKVSYLKLCAAHFERAEASFQLSDNKLTCKMKGHFASPENARAVVEPVLRAWEVATDLQRSRGELRFSFVGADIIDEHGVVVCPVSAPSGTSARMDPLPITRTEYPEPPSGSFRLNAEARTILHRYEGYLEQREPLQAMAYFCLTVLEGKGHHKRRNAADKYNIDIAVLDMIGNLTTEHGDDLNARKASAARPLTPAQQTWLEAAVKKLILQLATSEAERSKLEMSNLPNL